MVVKSIQTHSRDGTVGTMSTMMMNFPEESALMLQSSKNMDLMATIGNAQWGGMVSLS